MIRKGDVYRNHENNTACFVKKTNGDIHFITWSFRTELNVEVGRDEEVIKGPDGYVVYTRTIEDKMKIGRAHV